MLHNSTHALSTSLLHARLGQVSMPPPTEQQLVERLCNAATVAGLPTTDLVRAIYVGLKLRLGVCLGGTPTAQSMPLLETIVSAIVGTGSDQVVRLRVPAANDAVMRRFAALRISDIVSNALDPAQRDKVWFLLLQGDDATTLMTWAEHEIGSALGVETGGQTHWPVNLMVLATASTGPAMCSRRWLGSRASPWLPPLSPVVSAVMPPVGFQRQLLAARLDGSAYRQRLREAKTLLYSYGDLTHNRFASRWLAAAVDTHGQGLWVLDNPEENAERALAVLDAQVVHASA